MKRTITIIGGVAFACNREEALAKLNERTAHSVEWIWLQSLEENGYRLSKKVINGFVGRRIEVKSSDPVVKLVNLHAYDQSQLYRACAQPVLAPDVFQSVDELVEWLTSPDAKLIPSRQTLWEVPAREAALFCILAKLLRNKSWNKDSQGHQWTKDRDLMGQSPVSISDRQDIRKEANSLLSLARGTLLLRKGGTQGNTPLEWSINKAVLSQVMQAFMDRSTQPLAQIASLKSLLASIERQREPLIRIDDLFSEEQIRYICRMQDHSV